MFVAAAIRPNAVRRVAFSAGPFGQNGANAPVRLREIRPAPGCHRHSASSTLTALDELRRRSGLSDVAAHEDSAPTEAAAYVPIGVHLVGSVPLSSAEEVFRTVSASVGDRL